MRSKVIALRPSITGLADHDDVAESARSALRQDLGDEDLEVQEIVVEREVNTKGLATDLAVLLGTPGIIAGIVRVIHLWLSKDRRRQILLIGQIEGGRRVEVEIKADGMSEAAVREAVMKIVERLE